MCSFHTQVKSTDIKSHDVDLHKSVVNITPPPNSLSHTHTHTHTETAWRWLEVLGVRDREKGSLELRIEGRQSLAETLVYV